MISLSYIKTIFTTTVVVLVLIISLNYFVDPGANYYRSGGKFPDRYAKSLVNSDHGLHWSSNTISSRDLSLALSLYAKDSDCVVIGNSHSIQIGTYGKIKPLDDVCDKILNLSVAGGGIDDILILSYLAIKNGPPKKIILDIGPWTLSRKEDFIEPKAGIRSSSRYADKYRSAQLAILEIDQKSGIFFEKYLNLINLEYTKRSASLLWKFIQEKKMPISIVNVEKKFNTLSGIDSAVKLPDGSLVYPKSHINKQKHTPIPEEYFFYKNRTGKLVSKANSINALKKILLFIMESEVTPVVLLVPYHENLLKFKKSITVTSMNKNENILRQVGRELRVSVIGSYNPISVGCQANEFYDFQHPTRECLDRIKLEK
jgi:hypothetical protein